MPAQNLYSFNVSDASGTGVGPFNVTVMFKPTAASSPTAPGVTTGPLGSSGSAAAGAYLNLGDAIQAAKVFALDDHVLNSGA